jgi:hypothetical protein
MLLVGYLTIGITSELGVKVLASFQRITLEPWSIGMVSLTITARAMLPNGPGVKLGRESIGQPIGPVKIAWL